MKRRYLIVVMVALMIVVLASTVIFAQTHLRPVVKDTTCAPGGACFEDFGVYVQASGGPGGGCVDTYVGYIGWDLAPVATETWQSATLVLTPYNSVGGEAPFTFELYAPNNDSWTGTGADPGYGGAALGTGVWDGAAPTVEFDNPNALGAHFLAKKGGPASIAVVMTDGCGAVSGTVEFEDMEGTGGSLRGPESMNEADLVFWSGPDATDVSLSSLSADTQSVNWALYVGLAGLAVLVLGAVGYGYSRTR